MSGKFSHYLRKMDEFFGDATWSTRINSAKAAAGALREVPKPAFPIRLQVEVTNRCNINCIMCSRHENKLTLGDISPSLYDKISDLSSHAQETILFGYGEPLVSRAFYDLLPRLRSSRFGFFTNGLIMTPRLLERICSATKSKLSSLVFSIDGGTRETYNRIREKSDFDKVLENLAAIKEYRDSKKMDFELRIANVAMLDNIRELPELYERMDKIGVDSLFVNQLVVWDEVFRDQSLFYHPEECQKAFAETAALAKGRRTALDLPYDFSDSVPPFMPKCRMPWLYTMVSFEGDVRGCCFAPDVLTMGSLHDSSFLDIWHNEKYQKLRTTLRDGQDFPCCLTCENRFRPVVSPNDEGTYIKLKPREK